MTVVFAILFWTVKYMGVGGVDGSLVTARLTFALKFVTFPTNWGLLEDLPVRQVLSER